MNQVQQKHMIDWMPVSKATPKKKLIIAHTDECPVLCVYNKNNQFYSVRSHKMITADFWAEMSELNVVQKRNLKTLYKCHLKGQGQTKESRYYEGDKAVFSICKEWVYSGNFRIAIEARIVNQFHELGLLKSVNSSSLRFNISDYGLELCEMIF